MRAPKSAFARRTLVGLLAEWVHMHDYHTPFANGPPDKGQPCANVSNGFSTAESVECGKMFPRKLVRPRQEDVAYDPWRRELHRLWLSRNCNFINNVVPIVLLATLSNMDFQATTTKFGVVEHMTKCMTKYGQGSLLHVV